MKPAAQEYFLKIFAFKQKHVFGSTKITLLKACNVRQE